MVRGQRFFKVMFPPFVAIVWHCQHPCIFKRFWSGANTWKLKNFLTGCLHGDKGNPSLPSWFSSRVYTRNANPPTQTGLTESPRVTTFIFHTCHDRLYWGKEAFICWPSWRANPLMCVQRIYGKFLALLGGILRYYRVALLIRPCSLLSKKKYTIVLRLSQKSSMLVGLLFK